MLDCSTVRSVSAPTLDPKETAMSLSAHMDALVTAPSPRAEGSVTSTSSTQMHTSQLLMTMDVETLRKIPTTKGGLKTWVIATYQQHQRLHLLPSRLRPELLGQRQALSFMELSLPILLTD